MLESPEIIASACGAGAWPANTLEAARRCLDVQIDGIEVDAQLTRDHVVVLHHDYRFGTDCTHRAGEWLASPTAPISQLDFADTRRFDVGACRPDSAARASYPLREQWSDTPVPTLAEVWEAMARRVDRPRTLIVEIKTSPRERAESADLATLTHAVVDHLLAHASAQVRPRIIAFEWEVLRLARELAPEIPTGHLVIPHALRRKVRLNPDGDSPWADGHDPAKFGGSIARAVAAHGGTQLSVYHRDITDESMADAAAHGLTVAAWGLSDLAERAPLESFALDSLTVAGPDWNWRGPIADLQRAKTVDQGGGREA